MRLIAVLAGIVAGFAIAPFGVAHAETPDDAIATQEATDAFYERRARRFGYGIGIPTREGADAFALWRNEALFRFLNGAPSTDQHVVDQTIEEVASGLGECSDAADSWTVGVEREVDAGFYMSVYADHEGWRVWRTETKDGVSCSAVKPAEGRKRPVPLGSGSSLWQGTPFIRVAGDGPGAFREYSGTTARLMRMPTWRLKHYGKPKIKLRIPGEKFWDEYDSARFNVEKYDGKVVEIVAESWEYPHIHRGHETERGRFSFVGFDEAKRLAVECQAAGTAAPPG